MKKLFTFLFVALFGVANTFGQGYDSGDAAFVAGWANPVPSWWAKLPAAKPVKKQATSKFISNFDPAAADFDAVWTSIPGDGNIVGDQGSRLGLAASEKGAADFTGAFKVVSDESNIYILLKYTDDDVTGDETVEVAWAPYDTINAPKREAMPQTWYSRFQEFGAYKATFKKTGFDAAMMVAGATGAVNWGGTNDLLTPNLFLDDRTAVGSKTVKQIITIGFAALTGEARPEFNWSIWKMMNKGKGISLDLKVNDKDKDDALKADGSATAPAEYWWNAINNDSYALTIYAGYLSAPDYDPSSGDAAFVTNWANPVPSWWAKLPATKPAKKQANAAKVSNFDPASADFDTWWNKIGGNENEIGGTGSRLGLAASEKGAADFTGSFKAVYDDANIYILLKYTDDDVTGEETVEVAWAPYDSINAPKRDAMPQTWFTRYVEFGGYKATFKKTGFDAAMMVTGATGAINWGGTNDLLTPNLFLDDRTAVGSKTVKQIITIGFPVLTGEARPQFTEAIWTGLNKGKGISLDLKVNDKDKDDALKADGSATAPAEYWWNAINNDSYALTAYAGYLSNKGTITRIAPQIAEASIFGRITPSQVEFTKNANVVVYNLLGQQVKALRNVNMVDLSDLRTGIYIIRANNESRKIAR